MKRKSRTRTKSVTKPPKHAEPEQPERKPRAVAAADACDEAACRLKVVLGMLRDPQDDESGYATVMIEEAIEAVRGLLLAGSAEYSRAINAEGAR